MECPTCKAPIQPGDRFCGHCGERLGGMERAPPAPAVPAARGPAAPAAPPAPAAQQGGRDPFAAAAAARQPSAGGGAPQCPSCGSALTPNQPKCQVCGMEFLSTGDPLAGSASPSGQAGAAPPVAGGFGQRPAGAQGQAAGSFSAPRPPAERPRGDTIASLAPNQDARGMSGAVAPAPAPPAPAAPASASPMPAAEPRAGAPFCSIHGVMDATWTRCPQCIKEGREGRLSTPSGGLPRRAPEPAPAPAPRYAPAAHEPVTPFAASATAPAPAAQAPIGPPPAPAPQEPPVRPAAVAAEPPPPVAEPPRRPVPPQPAAVEAPQSSVGRTVVVRRRPRVLAYLIEKEGEQVGRAFQLEEDVTDIGRDPRNHLVVSDVLVSAFHARVERGPDGGFLVRDRGSTNGTRVNGQVLTEPLPIQENDEIGIGKTTLVLKIVA